MQEAGRGLYLLDKRDNLARPEQTCWRVVCSLYVTLAVWQQVGVLVIVVVSVPVTLTLS